MGGRSYHRQILYIRYLLTNGSQRKLDKDTEAILLGSGWKYPKKVILLMIGCDSALPVDGIVHATLIGPLSTQ